MIKYSCDYCGTPVEDEGYTWSLWLTDSPFVDCAKNRYRFGGEMCEQHKEELLLLIQEYLTRGGSAHHD